MNQIPEKLLSLAVTIYRKYSSSQFNLTVQIGPVQGTNFIFPFNFNFNKKKIPCLNKKIKGC